MATQIKITQLTDIGSANLSVTTLLPVVNMAGVPTTQKTTLGNLANVILSQSGGNYAPVAVANIAYSVANAAQPNITSVGTLTNLAVSGNATVNGNITSNGTAYVGNLSTTGLASITTLSVGATANLGAVANVRITGGTDGYVLQTDGTGNLSWTAQTGGGGNGTVGGANTQIQFNDAGAFAGNSGFTFNKTTGIFTSPFLAGNGNGLSNIAGANISGFVPNANVANTAFAVAAANVSGLGNIATINLTGSNSNVLYGNGVFAPTVSGTGISNGTSSVTIPVVNSNVLVQAGTNVWTFSSNGVATFPSGMIIESVTSPQPATALIDANGIAIATSFGNAVQIEPSNITVVANLLSWHFDGNGFLNFPGNARISADANVFEVQNANTINFESNSVVNIYTDTSNNAYQWQFGDDGTLTVPGGLIGSGASPAPYISGFDSISSISVSATGNISANNFTGNGGGLSNVATKVAGSWTLASGNNTVSLSVPLSGTYSIWVNGNIPNGIVTYTATAVVTNTNVPVLGEQYGWYYEAGNALVLTSIPNQFVGTQGVISNAVTYLGNTANVFTFGITNNSGANAVVNYGYTKL